jgi:uncharacterized membrane protein YhaH (DUF805 family)
MSFGEAVRTCFRKYADFSGRARPSEFWWWVLFYALVPAAYFFVIVSIAVALSQETADSLRFFTGILGVGYMALIVPHIAATVRRLQDTGRSGGYFFLSFIPCVGGIVLLAFLLGGSDPLTNKYGPPSMAPAVGPGGLPGARGQSDSRAYQIQAARPIPTLEAGRRLIGSFLGVGRPGRTSTKFLGFCDANEWE